jgi:hypothetical protein
MKKNDGQKGNERRILCRLVARELSPEVLGLVPGGVGKIDPVSTALVTTPGYVEDN